MQQFRRAIKLADQYIIDFEDAPELVDCVPLYYGLLWLGQAAAFAALDSTALRSRTPGHGVHVSFPRSDGRMFVDARLDFEKNSDSIPTVSAAFGGGLLAGLSVTVRDLIAMIPTIAEAASDFGIQTTAVKLDFYTDPDRVAGTSYWKLADVDDLSIAYLRDHISAWDYLDANGVTIDPGKCLISWKQPDGKEPIEEILSLYLPAADEKGFYLAPKLKKAVIHPYAIVLVLAFVMSKLARYEPDFWVQISEDQTDEMLLIRKIIDYAKRECANDILNQLSRRTIQPLQS